MNGFINCQTRVWRDTYSKHIKIKILYKVLKGLLTAKIANIKKFFFLYFLYIERLNIKLATITKETYENNDIEVVTDKIGVLWLNERHIQKLRLKHLPALTNKYAEEYKKCRYELNGSENNHIEDLFMLI